MPQKKLTLKWNKFKAWKKGRIQDKFLFRIKISSLFLFLAYLCKFRIFVSSIQAVQLQGSAHTVTHSHLILQRNEFFRPNTIKRNELDTVFIFYFFVENCGCVSWRRQSSTSGTFNGFEHLHSKSRTWTPKTETTMTKQSWVGSCRAGPGRAGPGQDND